MTQKDYAMILTLLGLCLIVMAVAAFICFIIECVSMVKWRYRYWLIVSVIMSVVCAVMLIVANWL